MPEYKLGLGYDPGLQVGVATIVWEVIGGRICMLGRFVYVGNSGECSLRISISDVRSGDSI